eukprot:TCONS_00064886-protein
MLNITLTLLFVLLSFSSLELTCCRADFYQLVDGKTLPENDLLHNDTEVITSISRIQCALRCSRQKTICQTVLYDEENRKCILQTVKSTQKSHGYNTWNTLQILKDQPSPAEVKPVTSLPEERSCYELLQKYPSLPSQEYNINFNGTEVFVYCDITQGQGGWTQIANIRQINQQSFSLSSIQVDTPGELSDRLLSGENYALSAQGLRDLVNSTGARQLRVYCSKPSVGRTFHIESRDNAIGDQILEYFSDVTATELPDGADSFDTLPGDTSYLTSHVHEWRFQSGKWGHGTIKTQPMKLYKNLVYISDSKTPPSYVYKVGMNSTPKLYCDDDGTLNSGEWKYFIR